MFRFSSPVTLRLEHGEALAFRRGLQAWIAVRAGVVHLTCAGDAEDHFLRPGEAFDLRGSRWVVIEPARRDQPVLVAFEKPGRLGPGALRGPWLAVRGAAAVPG